MAIILNNNHKSENPESTITPSVIDIARTIKPESKDVIVIAHPFAIRFTNRTISDSLPWYCSG